MLSKTPACIILAAPQFSMPVHIILVVPWLGNFAQMQVSAIQLMNERKSRCRMINNRQSMHEKSEQATIKQDGCSQSSHTLFHATDGLDLLDWKLGGLEDAG